MDGVMDVAAWRARIVEGVLVNPVKRVLDPTLRARLADPAVEVRFDELGFDSLALLELAIWLEVESGAEVGDATFAQHPGVLALARHLAGG
jgi:acyl carrier protein